MVHRPESRCNGDAVGGDRTEGTAACGDDRRGKLRGHVLMIGGLKEKLLAARMARVEKVLVPAKNQPDVEELSKEITKGMEIVYIKEMNEVIREAFVPEK